VPKHVRKPWTASLIDEPADSQGNGCHILHAGCPMPLSSLMGL